MKKVIGFIMSAIIGATTLYGTSGVKTRAEDYDYRSNLNSIILDFMEQNKSDGKELSCFENHGCENYWIYFTKETWYGTIGSACMRVRNIGEVISIIKSY